MHNGNLKQYHVYKVIFAPLSYDEEYTSKSMYAESNRVMQDWCNEQRKHGIVLKETFRNTCWLHPNNFQTVGKGVYILKKEGNHANNGKQ